MNPVGCWALPPRRLSAHEADFAARAMLGATVIISDGQSTWQGTISDLAYVGRGMVFVDYGPRCPVRKEYVCNVLLKGESTR